MVDYIRREDAIMTAMNYEGSGNAQDASQDIAAELASIPAADVRENLRGEWIDVEDKELKKAVERLRKNYEQAKTLGYVNNTAAWALYKTWKEFDRWNRRSNDD